MDQSVGKIKVVLWKIALSVSIIQRFQIPFGRLQNISNKVLRKSWMLGYFTCSNSKVAKFGK